MVWCVVWHGVVRCGVWCGVVWCCGVVVCGVGGVMWCGVVRCGVYWLDVKQLMFLEHVQL